jgi:hypothetical protein
MIIVGIKKKKENQQSILLRILANYFQLLTAALSFDLKFPTALTEIFYPVQKVGASSEAFLSIDCFFRDTEIRWFAPSNAIFKVFLTGLLPIFLILLAASVWGILYLISRKYFGDILRNIVVTTIVIIFLLHPTLTKVSLELFQWVEIDENKYNVKIDLEIEWYSADHLKWCSILSVPMLIVWVFGCPILIGIILFRNRHSLNEPHIQRYFLLLYQGLRPKVFYWEIINTLRKVLIVAVNVLMSTLPLTYSGITAVLILIFFIRLQLRLHPYKLEINNTLEIEAVVTGGSTLFWGIMFSSDDDNLAVLILLVLIVLITINVKFIAHWTFYMVYTLAFKYKLMHSFFMILGVGELKNNF